LGAKSKAANARSAARKRSAASAHGRGRWALAAPNAWEQTAQVPDERDGEIDCQRIVSGEGGRSLPGYYDEYN